MTHILLLEDERLLREDLTEFLVKQGHSVQAVGSIAEFDSGFVPGRHLIAILDLGLPDGDGMDVIARLRRDNLRLGIIVLTAHMAIRDKVAGLQSGADHYLTKTIDMDILAATVDALVRRLDTQINRLRRKVVDATGADLPLKTLRNEGYQFRGAVAPG